MTAAGGRQLQTRNDVGGYAFTKPDEIRLFTTDVSASATQVIETYTGRWNTVAAGTLNLATNGARQLTAF